MITRRMFGAAGLGAIALAGRPVQAEPAPLRVISAGGALTEIVFRLDAQALLVGTDTTSIFPTAAASLPKVGYLRQLSAEGVLSLRPTLLLTASEAGPPTVLQQLRAAGVQIVQGDGRRSIEALRANMRLLGDALQRAERGRALDAELQRDWAATQAAITRRSPAPRVLFVLSHAANQVQVAGTDTAADAMIRYAGGSNVMAAFSGYKPLAAEAVVAAASDIIVTTRQGLDALGGVDALLARPGLALTPAGKARRVYGPDALAMLGFGPRLPQAVRELAVALGTA
jgi:iron complex transport system substrate-binding protein